MTSLSRTGYGIAGLNIILELERLGVNSAVFPPITSQFQSIYANSQQEVDLIARAIERSKTFGHFDNCLKIWHQFELAQSIGYGRYVGFPIFELDSFTELEKHHLKYPDMLFVCSDWAKDAVINDTGINGDNVKVVPLGVNIEIFKPQKNDAKEKQPKNDPPYVFFNCGKWEIRKGHDILIDIFNQTFGQNDNVELWMMPHNTFLTQEEQKEWERFYTDSKLGNKIKILPECNTHYDLAKIMNETDCGIFPSRAEGWNLELLEMMALGKPVITTKYSAHTEFCTKDNSFLVDILELEPAYDGKWFKPGNNTNQGNWAKISPLEQKQFGEYMRHCYKERPDNPRGIGTAKRFTWENTVRTICKHLNLVVKS